MQSTICSAIQAKTVISFRYEGRLRTVEPHLLGYKHDGNLVLSAYQLSGGSGVDWRDFLLSKMSGIATNGRKFQFARPGYNPNDRTMSQVVCRL